MKNKGIILAAAMVLSTAACTQQTERTVSDTGTSATSTTTVYVPAVDTAATAQAKADVKDAAHDATAAGKEAGHDAADAGRDAAKATGTAMESAGKSIQKHAKPGDQH
jgi:hypothetical protein